ncbi:MAG: N-acetyltransferase [Rhizobiaceae bacterium]|nr:N-acetyltransferase [Rhizobiaceae bacterium]
MNINELTITTESKHEHECVEAMAARAFGPGRFARSAFRLREGVPHEASLSFVANGKGGQMFGSVRLTKIMIGDKSALLLGPLVVDPDVKNQGVGAMLMKHAVKAARSAGHELILLVGDLPYYQRFGFAVVPHGQISMPAPVERGRLLFCELVDGVGASYKGDATRAV